MWWGLIQFKVGAQRNLKSGELQPVLAQFLRVMQSCLNIDFHYAKG